MGMADGPQRRRRARMPGRAVGHAAGRGDQRDPAEDRPLRPRCAHAPSILGAARAPRGERAPHLTRAAARRRPRTRKLHMMKVVVLAGGLGTRLSEQTEIKPKPMVEIGGRPILWHV